MSTPTPQPPADEQAIALLHDLVSIDSPSHHEQAVVARCVEWMRTLGLTASVDASGSAVGVLGHGPRQIVLLGHIDTAPGHVPVRRDGDLLYGRGAVDAKGPLAAFIVAASRVGALPDAQITVIGAVEEECATSAGARHALTRYKPDACIIGEPSGWNRVTLGYKGRLLLDYALERPMAHSAGPERSACEQAVGYWLQVARWAEQVNLDKQGSFATLDASLREIRSSTDGLAERVTMTIGLRLPPGVELAALESALACLDPGRATVTPRGYEPPFRAEKRTPLVSAFLAGIRASGGAPGLVTKTGTSDMNVVGPVWGCPIVAYGPGDSTLDHTPSEHLNVTEYLTAIHVLTAVLTRLAHSAT